VHVDGPGQGDRVLTPHRLHDVTPGQNLADVAEQEQGDFELPACQVGYHSITLDVPLLQIDTKGRNEDGLVLCSTVAEAPASCRLPAGRGQTILFLDDDAGFVELANG
jgi:protein-disulfide isomerase